MRMKTSSSAPGGGPRIQARFVPLDAISLPSGEKATASTGALWPTNRQTSAPVVKSQSVIVVWSLPSTSKRLLSGVKVQLTAPPVGGTGSGLTSAPVAASKNRGEPLQPPDTRSLPSGDSADAPGTPGSATPRRPPGARASLPGARSQTRTV